MPSPSQPPFPNSLRPSAASETDWAAVLATHESWLRTIVFARLRGREGVEDVMQEIALAAVKQAAPVHDRSKIGPWLYGLAVRQCLMYRRKCGRVRRLHSTYAQTLPAATRESTSAGDPLKWLVAQERQQGVRQALERLPRRDAEILLLKYAENWNYHQIARHLGLSHSAVETRLHRARRKLREELAAWQTTEDQR
jgi:RNA polymerase sigma-70 factor (ECF subfamily)